MFKHTSPHIRKSGAREILRPGDKERRDNGRSPPIGGCCLDFGREDGGHDRTWVSSTTMKHSALCVVFTVCSSLGHFPTIASFSLAINSLVARGVRSREMLVYYMNLKLR